VSSEPDGKATAQEKGTDVKIVGDAIENLMTGKRGEAAAQLGNIVVAAVLAPLLGPSALLAGKAAEGAIKSLAARIANSATQRFLAKGQQLDQERATQAQWRLVISEEVNSAIAAHLEEVLSTQNDDIRALGLHNDEHFLQIVRFIRLHVGDPVEQILKTVTELKSRIAMQDARVHEPAAPVVSIGRLPPTGKHLFGRDKQLQALDQAWTDGKTHVITLVAWGGVGKTALINGWLGRLAVREYAGARRVYGWSFYNQGTTDRVASATLFVESALRWLGDDRPSDGSPWDKGERLARLLQKERTLLVLDGLEPLQFPPGQPNEGRVKDLALQAMLRDLAAHNPGLCIVSTRMAVADLADFESSTVRQIDLEHLAAEAGAQLLRVLGVQGDEVELQKASDEFGGHSLALTLLGTYLTEAYDADIRRRDVMGDLTGSDGQGGHARRVMTSYESWFGEGPELAVLRLLGLFDRPADAPAVTALRTPPAIEGLTDALLGLSPPAYKQVLARLRRARLLAPASDHQGDALDAHPLVREHFGKQLREARPAAWREGNARLYEHLKQSSPELPETLEAMDPLYAAVAHGCQAGRHQRVMDDVYLPRILRGKLNFSTLKLGAFGAEVAAMSCFFAPPWTQVVDGLNESTAAHVLRHTGYCLRSVIRLEEAADVLDIAHRTHVERQEWLNAADDAGILNYLYLTSGKLQVALQHAERCVAHAERSGDRLCRLASFSRVGATLHQLGRLAEAEAAFQRAEARQLGYPQLFSIPGYQDVQFCDFLLDRKESGVVERRLAPALAIATQEKRLLPAALIHWLLGRACVLDGRLQEGLGHARLALQGVRQAARPDYLPPCLLTNAELALGDGRMEEARRDLEEATLIATRSRMGLVSADCHLLRARLHLSSGEPDRARQDLERARQMIRSMGYRRRDDAVRYLEERSAGAG
jgi:tetratricopeptide (TPR) repeat protein